MLIIPKASPTVDSTISIPETLIKTWTKDPKHGQEFQALCDRFAEEFKPDPEDSKKVKKRVFRASGGGGQPSTSKVVKTVDMTGLSLKPISDEPQNETIVEVNLLNLPDCKLVIQNNGSVYVKNLGEKKAGDSPNAFLF